ISNECDERHTTFDGEPTFKAEEQQTLAAGLKNITVHGAHNGGITLQGTTGDAVEVHVCKLVAAEDSAAGQRRLAMGHPVIGGGAISGTGPDDGRWVVHFMVSVPSGSSVKLEAYNGPIAIRDVNADVNANTRNGPIAIKRVAGNVTVQAQNGPIHIAQ